MENKKKRNNTLLWLFTLLPTIITTIVIPFMPDRIPLHYDIHGNIDRWGSKYENYIFPVIIILFTLFWCCLLQYFQKQQLSATAEKEQKEAENNEKIIWLTAVGMALMFGIMHYFIMYSAYMEAKKGMSEMAIDSSVVINVLMGIFIVCLGNILPKAKMNSIAGVRTVWSMENEKTWAVSNRFGGITFVIAGILSIIESFIWGGILSTFIMLGIILCAGIVCVVYSYQAYRKYK